MYLIVGTDGPQLHDELEAEKVVGADGLELQETAEGHQLRPGQVVQGQLVLEQFGEAYDLLIAGTLPGVPDLQGRTTCRHWTFSEALLFTLLVLYCVVSERSTQRLSVPSPCFQ